MRNPGLLRALTALLLLASGCLSFVSSAADIATARIVNEIDNTDLFRLRGNTRPEARAEYDRGRASDSLTLPHLQLLLRRETAREAQLQVYLRQVQDRSSPNFHRWLTADEYGERFGIAKQDVAKIVAWLQQEGFTVNTVYPGGMVIDFSGNVAQVASAFHTEIHTLEVNGVRHIANWQDPSIPVAIAAVVNGIVSLNDFRPHTYSHAKPAFSVGGAYPVVPADLATIYDLNPLFTAGVTGQGQTVVVVEDTDVFDSGDWGNFRTAFGLSIYPGSFTQTHPGPSSGTSCSDPGVVAGNEFEAEVDAEWASAAAPGATIVLASCRDTTTFGGLIALENLVNSQAAPAIVSISYGECEAGMGAAANAAFNEVYEQAVAQGTSVFVAAGDAGAAACNPDSGAATLGIGVNGFASSPYAVAVGGTDFGDTYDGTSSSYWSATNTSADGSALSYIPEIPWNDSCAGLLLATASGDTPAYGSGGFCNSAAGTSYLTTLAGSGGPSACAGGAPATSGIVGGSCAGYAKPSWQKGLLGVPLDNVRDLPDVSLFAANGVWGHFYVVCDSDAADKYSCAGAPSGWSGAGGTSFAAPIMAGIQALINQQVGARQGNPNPIYYSLATAEYGASGTAACNSTKGNAVASACIFYDVTRGDMSVNCTGNINCYSPSGTYGVLSTSDGTDLPAYSASSGWDFATGIGTPNVTNLAAAWETSNLSLTGGGTIGAGGLLSYTWTITNGGPQAATGVLLSANLPAGVTFDAAASSAVCRQTGQSLSCAVGTMSVGSKISLNIVLYSGGLRSVAATFTVTASNGVLYPATDSVTVTLSGVAVPMPLWSQIALAGLLIGVWRYHRAASLPSRLVRRAYSTASRKTCACNSAVRAEEGA